MAPGDLNLKKSWHPGLMKNQQKVWELEQEALKERKKIQERQDEIAKERELAELRALQYAKTGKKVSDRVEWMYDTSGVGDGGKLMTSESEEYLLGKKRVDNLILKGNSSGETPSVKRGFEKLESSFQMSERDLINRNRDDPMAKIKEQQMRKLHELRQKRKLEEDRMRHKGDERHRSRHGSHHSRHRTGREDRHSSHHSQDGSKKIKVHDRYERRTSGRPTDSREDSLSGRG